MKKGRYSIFRACLELCKIKISAFSSLSAATGFLLCRRITPEAIVMIAGVFLLACGSCGMNQCQERDLDALMPRTKNRPIPSGRLKPVNALVLSVILMSSGVAALAVAGSLPALLLGVLAVIWYNGIYTPFKRRSAFAAIPGALIGVIPPAIGWVTGGGGFLDPKLLVICFFFFMWQVPHFWLLMLDHGKEYERAGLPSLSSLLRKDQMSRIVFVWICASAVSSSLITASGLVQGAAISLLVVALAAWLILNGIGLLREKTAVYVTIFKRINAYIFLIMALLAGSRYLS